MPSPSSSLRKGCPQGANHPGVSQWARPAAQLLALVVFLGISGASFAGDDDTSNAHDRAGWFDSLCERDTLTGNWLGLGDRLEEAGVATAFGLTQVYQVNLTGGLATGRHAGRYAGSYDWESELDLETMFKLPGSLVSVHVEGGWSDGLGASSIGSVMDVNGDAFGYRTIILSQLYWQQTLLDGRAQVRIGKLDLTGGYACRHSDVAFDSNAYANDETGQFLNAVLVNNPTIPFPEYGLGFSLFVEPIDGWYVSAAVADAEAARTTGGFKSAFGGRPSFFAIFETGLAPLFATPRGCLPGGYRVGFWHDMPDKAYHDGSGIKGDDLGFYVSVDQLIFKERPHNDEDSQGAGVFFRLGIADGDVNEIHTFWSVGAQYQGLVPTRDDDVLGFGVAQGRLAGADAGFTTEHETVIEVYYGIQVTPWFTLAPSAQYLLNPGGSAAVDNALVMGFRAQIDF